MSVKWNADEVMRRIRAGTMRGVMRGTERVHDKATRLIMDPPKTGKHHRGLPNRSSAPGEAPATQSGRLQQSGRTIYNEATLSGVASWSSEHALPLEVGTEKIAPRPYARRALAEEVEGIRQDVAAEIARELNT